MKLILWASVAAFVAIGTAWGQEPPTGFSFTWESGEHSRDMSIDRVLWQLDGTTLRFSQTVLGRNEGMPTPKSMFRDRTGLNKGQLAKLTSILEGLVNENSLSLLPENYEGTLTEYTLSFGNPPRVVFFSASQYSLDQIEKENSPGAAKPSKPAPGSVLYLKMNALRDYLVELSRRS
jgi:hypothetical protein